MDRIKRMVRLSARLSSFVGVWVLSSLSSFVLLPVLARQVSIAEWTAVAIGQSIGSIGGLATSYGWNAAGPHRIARSGEDERLSEYARSLTTRGLIFLVSIPLTALAALILAPANALLAWSMAIAWSINGVTAIWFNVGEGRARDAVIFDLVPKGIATVGAAAIIFATGNAISYPLALIGATAVGILAFSFHRFPSGLLEQCRRARPFECLRRNLSPAASDFLSGAFNASIVVLASPTTPTGELARYASADKAYRMGGQVVTSLSNAFQGWVAEHDELRGRRRRVAAVYTHAVLGVVGGTLCALLGPWATEVLYGADLRASEPTMVYLGVALGLLCITTSLTRHVLLPTGRTREVLRAAAAGLAAAAIAIPSLSHSAGSAGVAAAVAITQLVTLAALTAGTLKEGF